MMTSANENIFRVTGHLCGEFTGPDEFPAQRPVTRGFDFFSLICAWINVWVNNRGAGDLRRHRAHYDVIVMWINWHVELPNHNKTHQNANRVDCNTFYVKVTTFNSDVTRASRLKSQAIRLFVKRSIHNMNIRNTKVRRQCTLGFCEGNSSMTGTDGFPSQRVWNAEKFTMLWPHEPTCRIE